MNESQKKEVIVKAIMKHAGLSEWDRSSVEEEATAILNALGKKNLKIVFDPLNHIS